MSNGLSDEYSYLFLLQQLLRRSNDPANLIPDRTGTGRYGLFGAQMRFDLRGGIVPILTTKKVFYKAIIHELIWIMRGDTNIKYLLDNDVHIWDEWADKNGELGPVYGKQWRRWDNPHNDPYSEIPTQIDQLANVIQELKSNRFSTRHLVSAWNPADVPAMALPPCHTMFQFHVSTTNELSCQLYQRSADMFLGVPFNIASYAILTHVIAKICGYTVGDFIHTLGDYHIYANHIEAVKTQVARTPNYFPTIEISREDITIDDLVFDDIKIKNYRSHPTISAPVSI